MQSRTKQNKKQNKIIDFFDSYLLNCSLPDGFTSPQSCDIVFENTAWRCEGNGNRWFYNLLIFNLNSMMFTKDHGIILACDVSTIEDAEGLARLSIGIEEVVGFKIGFTLGLRFGLRRVTDALKQINPLPVIYDHQKAGTDIPQMGEPFARTCKDGGVDGVIVFSQAGPNTLEAFVSAIGQHGMTAIVGGVMTHPGYLSSDGGYIQDEAPARIYQAALEMGVKYFVLPGNKTGLIRKYAEILNKRDGISVMMPGIGSQGGELDTAFDACDGVKPYAIIGSAIYNARDPRKALDLFVSSLHSYSAGK